MCKLKLKVEPGERYVSHAGLMLLKAQGSVITGSDRVPVLLSWDNLNFSRNRDMILYILGHIYFPFLQETDGYKLSSIFGILGSDVLIIDII